jgi:hypothetical protein
MKPTQAAAAAQGAILTLRTLALEGNRSALEELWRIGMLACDQLDGLAMNGHGPEIGEATRAMARRKTSWPFKLAAVHEIRHAKNTASNPDKFAEWIRLGEDTGIKLANPGKGGTRTFKTGTTAGLAYHVRRQIEQDLKAYGKLSDAEIIATRYWAWPYTQGEKPSSKSQRNFLEYIQAARGVNNLHDEGQWMKAATLWLDVAYQGKVNDDDGTLERWPQDIYDRARKEKRSIGEVVLTRLQEGFASIVKPSSPKNPLG